MAHEAPWPVPQGQLSHTPEQIPPLNNLNFRTVAVTLIGVPLIPILAKAVLDLKDLRSRRNELMRLIFFEDYETAVSPLLGTAEAAAGSQAAPRSGAKNRAAKPRRGKRA